MDLIWSYLQYGINSPEVLALSSEVGVSPIVAVTAANRGILTSHELQTFIKKDNSVLPSPFLFEDMDRAVDRINTAIENNEKICIYGDYDVDGITSTALLCGYLRGRGANCSYYIPGRSNEGYGINMGAIEHLHHSEVKLIISVDTGITAVAEVEYVKSLGMDIIVTDHHQCKELLPDCAIINPQHPNCVYPFKNLSGVGVAFKLACALEGNSENIIERYSELVALGTIADVVSLTGENRSLVSAGLQHIQHTNKKGIIALLEIAGLAGKPISVVSIGFGIAPRINAAGRMGNADVAVRLLLSQDGAEARELAQCLDNENKNRQQTESTIFKEALEIIEQNPEYMDKNVIVLYGDGWHHGVIGIVASRITDKYHRPCVLISCENGIGKGSGRSIKGFNLFEALNACSHLLEKYGGHELAAGLSLNSNNLKEFEQTINQYAITKLEGISLSPTINIDCELSDDYINVESAKALSLLEPFGMGNPTPVFSVCGVKLCDIRTFTEGKHIRFDATKGSIKFELVGFNKGKLNESFTIGDTVNVAGTLSVNEWNGQCKVQILIKDILLNSDSLKNVCTVPTRDDLAGVYTYIKKNGKNSSISSVFKLLPRMVANASNIEMHETKLLHCLDIFTELCLATYTIENDRIDIYLLDCGGKKVDLEKSKKLQLLRTQNNM